MNSVNKHPPVPSIEHSEEPVAVIGQDLNSPLPEEDGVRWYLDHAMTLSSPIGSCQGRDQETL